MYTHVHHNQNVTATQVTLNTRIVSEEVHTDSAMLFSTKKPGNSDVDQL